MVPFNQGSKRDVEALIDYVYTEFDDLDFMIPFAAIPENGREIDGIDSKSELAHRIMLTNLLRLMGCIKVKKADAGFETRPTQSFSRSRRITAPWVTTDYMASQRLPSKLCSTDGTQKAGAVI